MFTRACLVITSIALLLSGSPALAQRANIDKNVLRHAVNIANLCPGAWESDNCLKALSLSNKDLAVKYAVTLDAKGQKNRLEQLKQICAAATVTEEEVGENVPAYAFLSAYTECANGIYEISEATKVQPDASHYQLLIGAVLCLNKSPQCAALEDQMKPYQKLTKH